RFARRSAPTSCAAGTSTSGRPLSERSAPPAARRSTASTSALRVHPSASSRTGATTASPADRASLTLSPETVTANYERIGTELGPEVTIVAARSEERRGGKGCG